MVGQRGHISTVDDTGDQVDTQYNLVVVAIYTVSCMYSCQLNLSDVALVVLLRTDTWQSRRGGIEYNLTFLRQGVRRIMLEV